jgi:hypothetical protein
MRAALHNDNLFDSISSFQFKRSDLMLTVTLEYTRSSEALHFTSLLSTFTSLFAVPSPCYHHLRCLHHISPACYLKKLSHNGQLTADYLANTIAAAAR